MNHKTLVIILSVLIPVLVIGLTLGLYFGLKKNKKTKTTGQLWTWATPKSPVSIWCWNQPGATAGWAGNTASISTIPGLCGPYLWDDELRPFTDPSATGKAATMRTFLASNKQIGGIKLSYMGFTENDTGFTVRKMTDNEKKAITTAAKELSKQGYIVDFLIGQKIQNTGKTDDEKQAELKLYTDMMVDAATFIKENNLLHTVGISVDIEPAVADLNVITSTNTFAGIDAWYAQFLPGITEGMLSARKAASDSKPLRIGFAVNHNVQYSKTYSIGDASKINASSAPWQWMLVSGAVNIIEVMGWITPYNVGVEPADRLINQCLGGYASKTRNFWTDAKLNTKNGGGYVQIGVEVTGDPMGFVKTDPSQNVCYADPSISALLYDISNDDTVVNKECSTLTPSAGAKPAAVIPFVAGFKNASSPNTACDKDSDCSSMPGTHCIQTNNWTDSSGASRSRICAYPTPYKGDAKIGAKLMAKLSLVQGSMKVGDETVSELGTVDSMWSWLSKDAINISLKAAKQVTGEDQLSVTAPLTICVEDMGGLVGLVNNYSNGNFSTPPTKAEELGSGMLQACPLSSGNTILSKRHPTTLAGFKISI